jgi:hypothetical protein
MFMITAVGTAVVIEDLVFNEFNKSFLIKVLKMLV